MVSSLDAGAVVVAGGKPGEAGAKVGTLWKMENMCEQETVSSTVGLLHNKVDKMVRLMVETSENQKKMNKVRICLVRFPVSLRF